MTEARPQEREIPEENLPRGWRRRRREPPFHGLPGKLYYEREDGAYAWFDETNASDTARPWLEGYRPWVAFPPPPPGLDRDRDFWPPLCYQPTRGRRSMRGCRNHAAVTRRWKTASGAIAALDREHPAESGGRNR